jgi:hypothetical protein
MQNGNGVDIGYGTALQENIFGSCNILNAHRLCFLMTENKV